MERRKFTREFKLEAVRLIKDRGVSYVQASRDLGVHPSQLRDWVICSLASVFRFPDATSRTAAGSKPCSWSALPLKRDTGP
jgi:transposase-like protein